MLETIPGSRSWLEVDLGVLRANVERVRTAVHPAQVIAVVKADAYGLGAAAVVRVLARAGATAFAVADAREALELDSRGLPVHILGEVFADELAATIAAGVVHPVACEDSARAISSEAERQNRTAECQILVDSGMGRLGIPAAGAPAVIRRIVALPYLRCCGIYTHFPMASRAGEGFTRRQVAVFRELLDALRNVGICFRSVHIANSPAVNTFPVAVRPPFNRVRVGIDLYGGFDEDGSRSLGLAPVVAMKSRLAAVRTLPAGTPIGYDCTHTLSEDTRVGTVAAGYADGIPLALSNRGHVLVRGKCCPILGRVSMDYTTVSLANVPEAVKGDEVTCLGSQGKQAITVEQWADMKGTHAYDILCSFGRRCERRYTNA